MVLYGMVWYGMVWYGMACYGWRLDLLYRAMQAVCCSYIDLVTLATQASPRRTPSHQKDTARSALAAMRMMMMMVVVPPCVPRASVCSLCPPHAVCELNVLA